MDNTPNFSNFFEENMNKQLIQLEYDKIISLLEKYCKTYIGKKKLSSMLPSFSFEEVQKLLSLTTEAINMKIAFGNIPLSDIAEIEPYFKLIKSNINLSYKALLDVAKILYVSSDLKKYFYSNISNNSNSFSLLEDMFSSLYINDTITKNITDKIIDENTIADNASPILLNLRKKRKILEQRLKDKLLDLIHSKSKFMMDSIITIRDGRYVIPVKEECRNEIKGLVHDISSSGSTLYIEPISTFEMNNEIQNIKIDEEKEINNILRELTLSIAPIVDNLLSNIDTIGNLDLIFAKATYSTEVDGCEPTLNKDKYINFVKVRHPLIDKDVVVPINVEIGKDFSCLVITGPNTGGKTATLKTVGLNLLLAYSGIYPLCNNGTNICVFDNIFIDIGDEQSIQASLSTFSSHMLNIINITNLAQNNSLVLLDELGSGTDPIEGASLAISTLNYLFNKGCIILATTHYPELKNYALVTEGFKNASCDFDVANLKPTYKLLVGIPGKSNAFAISKKLGLKEEILKNAESNVHKNVIHIEDLLKNIYDNKLQIENEKIEIDKNLKQVQDLRKSLEKDKNQLDQEHLNLLADAEQKAKNIILSAKEEANEIIKELNKMLDSKNTNLKNANMLRNKLNAKLSDLSVSSSSVNSNSANNSLENQSNKLENDILKKEDIKIGMTVFVVPLQKEGIVQTLPNRSNEVTVQVGSAKTNIKINNLRKSNISLPHSTSNNQANHVNSAGKSSNNLGNTSHSIKSKVSFKKSEEFKTKSATTEINVIGLTVEEATQIIDKYLDNCILFGIPTVRIVHGKGTGKLMHGIHSFLKTNPYVKSFRIGAYGEGDLGVTVVELGN